MRFLSAIILILTFAGFAQAQADDPQFQRAINAWLQDDDAHALPMLSGLAKAGNEDAMILLGVLNHQAGEMSPYLLSLSKELRVALYRTEGGLSGQSWLSKVVEQAPFATAILNSTHADKRNIAVRFLLNNNASALVVEPMLATAGDGDLKAIETFVSHKNFPAHLRMQMIDALPNDATGEFAEQNWEIGLQALNGETLQGFLFARRLHTDGSFRGLRWQRNVGLILQVGEAATYADDAFDDFGDKYPGKLPPALREQLYQRAGGIIMADPILAPIAQLCQARCPSEPSLCARAVFSVIGGYNGFTRIHTPVERYIPAEIFTQSQRFAAQIKRQATSLGLDWHSRKPISQCAAKLFADN